jgi:hypothetical protein
LLPVDTKVRSSKYLNDLIEQDHRCVKQRLAVMLDFKRFRNAAGTVGSECPAGCCHRPGLEEQAQLLSGGDAGRHDPAAGPTDDGGASWRYGP